ncbi:hypothetical protein ACHAO4_004204 [Trichoderma viride]
MVPTTSRIIAQGRTPSGLLGVPSTLTTFFVNRQYASEHSIGGTYSGQMYVELYQPVDPVATDVQRNIVLLHGDFFTGQTWLAKPDGTPSWAAFFLNKGYNVFVVDLPGVGKSSFLNDNDYQVPGVPRTVRRLTADLVEQEFTASEKCPLPDGSFAWATASEHNQWPGTGCRGDPIFESLMASTTDMVLPKLQHEELGTIAVTDLLKQIGPSFLLGHGTGATIGMLTADAKPRLVRGIITIEPDGPPCARSGSPVNGRMKYTPYLQYDPNIRRYGISDAPLTFSPALQPAPGAHPLKTQVHQSPDNNGCNILQQKQDNIMIYNIRDDEGQDKVPQLINLARVPHVMYTSHTSPHSVYDWATTSFLRQAGDFVDWWFLPKHGVRGNGHLIHLERNSDAIVRHIDLWAAACITTEDEDREQRINAQRELEERFQRHHSLMNGPRDEQYELEFVVQPDTVAHQPSPAFPTASPTADLAGPVATVDLAGPVATADLAGPVATIDLAGPVATVDLAGPVATFDLAGPIATADLAGPVATIDPRILSFDQTFEALEVLPAPDQVEAYGEATLGSGSGEPWQWASFDEMVEQAARPFDDSDPVPNQVFDPAWGLYTSSTSPSSAETRSFGTADIDMETLPEWDADLYQHEYTDLLTSWNPEIEDRFAGEWAVFLNEDIIEDIVPKNFST